MILAERYQVIRPLAQGGFGKTFLACDRHLPGEPQCVIKQLLLASESSQSTAARQEARATAKQGDTFKTAQRLFNLEAQTLYQLGTHSQIPTLLAHFEQAGEFYLVQEYIPGEPLDEEFASGDLPRAWPGDAPQETRPERVKYAQAVLKDLLTVLAFVQQQNVIHRDIKPANIIRRAADRRLVLIDFGAVKLLSSKLLDSKLFDPEAADPDETKQVSRTVAIGSPGYMAPEQQAGRPCFASDLYAVGIVGLQALTGLSPKQMPVNPSTGRFRLEVTAENRSLLTFVNELTHIDPNARFPDASSALQALESLDNLSFPETDFPETDFPEPNFPETGLSKTASLQATQSQPAALQPVASQSVRPQSIGTPSPPPQIVPGISLTPAEVRNRQALLNKVHRFWIQGVLEHSLHGQVLLTLGLEERAAALALPWNISVQTDEQTAHPLDSGTQVFDVFQQLGEGRSLLILGEPGAGKTTTLLTLARDLLAQVWAREQASKQAHTLRMPAIFNLSSWTGGPIDQWLVTELNSKYQIPKAIGQRWVSEQQLQLLLDGLDEVRQDRQDSCAAALNQFHQDYGPELVVCCRIKDYEAMDQRLGFQSALYVRSLTDQQIWHYLEQADTGLTGLKSLLKRSSAQSQVSDADNPSLLDLARSPLILNIMALTYQGISASEIPTLNQGENYTQQLFSAYIDRMFERRGLAHQNAPYTKQQTLRWLHVLAAKLTNSSQTVFLIERMQPTWLTSRLQRGVYALLVWLTFLVTATTIGSQVVSPRSLPLALVFGGIVFVRIFGLYRIVPAESLRWSWQKASRALLLGLTVGPLTGWFLKVSFAQIFGNGLCIWQRECFQETSLLGLAFGAVLGITYGVIRGLSGERIATVTKPNQGIRQSGKNAILFAVVSSITPFFVGRFMGNTSPAFWAAAGLCFGLALGGGEACVKHGILRFILFCQGRIPWHYPKFLDYAAERIFLQKVGGGYIFIHRLLLEHFAALTPEKKLKQR
ncbi:MAG: protein kinase [Cyanobacteria bacterium J06635_11]